jgi:hypothetical protein
MATTFDIIREDFSAELDTIRTLVATSDERDTTSTAVKIASSNASMLLLAASFEEFVRECVREFVVQIVSRAAQFADIPPNVGVAVWERAIYLLRGLRYGSRDFDRTQAVTSLTYLQDFCLDETLATPVSDLVAYNQNNLKCKEINDMFRRCGIADYCGALGRLDIFIDFFGSPSADKAHADFMSYLDNFYDSRNEVAHAIGSRKATGSTDIERHLDFFGCLAQAICADLNERAAAV